LCREDRTAAFAVEKPSLQRDFTSRRSLLVVAASLSVLLLFLKAFEHYGLLLSTFIPGMQVAPKNVPIAR
jgi:cyanate permease